MSTYLIPLLNAAAVGAGPWFDVSNVAPGMSFAAFLPGGVAPTATVTIDTSLDKVNILAAGAGTLSVTGTAPGTSSSTAPLLFVRANITAIAGGGSVTVQMAGKQ